MTQSTIFALCAGGLVLGIIAVVIDRLNFPQRRFIARGVRSGDGRRGPVRDRTGAHIVDDRTDSAHAEPSGPTETDQTATKG